MTDAAASPASPDGLTIVDKPAGWTSHDVVARVRRLAHTRRVGHAGTLDPMATGVLVVGVGRATRLLGQLALTTKSYDATVRLGQQTTTDDADGELVRAVAADEIGPDRLAAALAGFRGEFAQVPPAISAVKFGGRRAYARTRAGESVDLAPRHVRVDRLELRAVRGPGPGLLDVDVSLDCSSGTYVRAIARDLGGQLGVGGHLRRLRRTRVGTFTLDDARTLDQLAEFASPVTVSLSAAVAAYFPRLDVDAAAATTIGHGGRLPEAGICGRYGVFGPDGEVVALAEDRAGAGRPVVVLRPA